VRSGLPIDAALPALLDALRTHTSTVLEAPPGAGKSTVVPLALLEEPWAQGKRLLLLEPRRVAARAVAARMAQTLGESPGGTIGYRMRLETRVSRATPMTSYVGPSGTKSLVLCARSSTTARRTLRPTAF